MNIAVTGGTGFVGLELIRQLLAEGHVVRVWHRSASDLRPLQELAEQFETSLDFQVGELDGNSSGNAEARFLDGMDAVVHSGLWRESQSFQQSPTNVGNYAATNIIGSLRLIESAFRLQLARFVFVSTCAVHDVILDDRPLDEAHPLWARTHYGAHKAAIEKFVHSFGLGQQMPICAIRPTGVYGVRWPLQESKWYALIDSVRRGQPTTVQRGGKEVHVGDVAASIRILLGAPEADILGRSFACYDRYISEYDVATLANQLAGKQAAIQGSPKSPQHEIETGKIRSLGASFGGESRLRETIESILSLMPAV